MQPLTIFLVPYRNRQQDKKQFDKLEVVQCIDGK